MAPTPTANESDSNRANGSRRSGTPANARGRGVPAVHRLRRRRGPSPEAKAPGNYHFLRVETVYEELASKNKGRTSTKRWPSSFLEALNRITLQNKGCNHEINDLEPLKARSTV
jgi:hypothetical protein